MVKKVEMTAQQNLRGGEGTIYFKHLLSKDELMGHGKMYAHVIIPPHSSIGVHTHVHDTEPYYIIKGEATFIDEDGSRKTVHAGEICTIPVGASHGMINETEEDMEMIALIINEG